MKEHVCILSNIIILGPSPNAYFELKCLLPFRSGHISHAWREVFPVNWPMVMSTKYIGNPHTTRKNRNAIRNDPAINTMPRNK